MCIYFCITCYSLRRGASLQVFQTSLTNLGLESLTQISYGTIFVSNNSRLCYADSIKWTQMMQKDTQKVIVVHNRNGTACGMSTATLLSVDICFVVCIVWYEGLNFVFKQNF